MWNKTNKRKGNASTALEDSINGIFFMRIEILKRSAVMLYLTVVFSVFTIAQNKIGFVSPERRYEAPTVARPPQM